MELDKEAIEATLFDKEVSNAYEDNKLILSKEKLEQYINFTSRPVLGFRYAFYLLKDSEIKDQKILNIACGTGYEAVVLAKKGAMVSAFDISPESIKIAKKRILLNNCSDRLRAEVMSVYDLKFDSSSFMYIFGIDCLHHFEIEKAMKEIHRVLKSGGKAIFFEPLGASEVFQRLRNYIPIAKDKTSPFERQLNHCDLKCIERIFKRVKYDEFGLFMRLDRLIKNQTLLKVIYKIDDRLLKTAPYLKKFARHVVIEIDK
jgi:ubiquinone/menaquinone biosynthesis C-methylase UbiE